MKHSFIIEEKGKKRKWKFPEGSRSATIGRDPSNDLQILEIKASRKHCEISTDDGDSLVLMDLKSSNGTKLNNQEVDREVLKPGDVIKIGKTKITFQGRAKAPTSDNGKEAPEEADEDIPEAVPAMDEEDEEIAAMPTFALSDDGDQGAGNREQGTEDRITIERTGNEPLATNHSPLETPEKKKKKKTKVVRDEDEESAKENESGEPENDDKTSADDSLDSVGKIKLQGDNGDKKKAVVASQQSKKYELVGRIGAGGMSSIVKVEDRDLMRVLAMKLLIEGNKASVNRVSRFQAEAQVTAQLDHPNIVPIHDLGIDSKGRPFFTMKLVSGLSLLDVVERMQDGDEELAKRFSQRRFLGVLLQVCNAISFSHARGVIHRDLKNSNVMVGDYGEVYVMDWGLAKVLGRAGEGTATTEDSNYVLTNRQTKDARKSKDGIIAGTPSYMSPEQALGKNDEVDERTDVYSLGGMLYEYLTGTPPFLGDDPKKVMLDVVEKEIEPPGVRNPKAKVPAELSAITMKALSKDRELRYASVKDFAEDISSFLEGKSVSAKKDNFFMQAVKWTRRHWIIPTIVGAVVVTALTVVFVLLGAFESMYDQTPVAKALYEEGKFFETRAETVRKTALDLIDQTKFEEAFKKREEAEMLFAQAIEKFAATAAIDSLFKRQAEERLDGLRAQKSQLIFEQAEKLVLQGNEFKNLYANIRNRALGDLQKQVFLAERNVQGYEDFGDAVKQEAIEFRRQLADLEARMDQAFLQAQDRYLRALTLVPYDEENPKTADFSSALARLYLLRFRTSEDSGNDRDARYFMDLVSHYDVKEEFQAIIVGDAELVLNVDSRGENVSVTIGKLNTSAFRFDFSEHQVENHPDGFVIADASKLESGMYSLAPPYAGKRVSLPMGSYMLYVTPEDGSTLMPLQTNFIIGRGRPATLDLKMYSRSETPPGCALVSSGKMLRENEATNVLQETNSIDSFFIGINEVSLAEYLEYCTSLPYVEIDENNPVEPPAESQNNRLPSNMTVNVLWSDGNVYARPFYDYDQATGALKPVFPDGRDVGIPNFGNQVPVLTVRPSDAEGYCHYLTRKYGNQWEFRLPTEEEWERAYRGADGRLYPWGNKMDFTFCASSRARQSEPTFYSFDEFPLDVSPFGIKYMAGNAAEWTSTKRTFQGFTQYRLKGGGWSFSVAEEFAAWNGLWVNDFFPHEAAGFRVVATAR
ncbi:MAG: SUMF1/EgtB/PvdO family nonheme iron enzyme [Planctomycetes bacterium]|nr:SUMF1/EgtB/PvdO family nonheme iron enzyme [Planctomycetota bacterium]